MNINRAVWRAPIGLLAVMTSVACSDGTGVSGGQSVALNFKVTSASGPAPAPGPSLVAGVSGGPSLVAGPPMTLTGTNGSLSITEIRIIVNEVELEPSDGSCDLVDNSDDADCPDFEAPPRFLDLPLDGNPIDAVTDLIPPGTYDELEFEVEDLEDDEVDPVEAAAIAAVRSQILAVIPDWPDKASALVVGTFQPAGGNAVGFRVFLDAEIEVEMDLLPNLVIGEGGTTNRSLTVDIRPDIWFVNVDGTVTDLSQWDFDSTQMLLDFELEMEGGFTEIEIDG